MVKGLISCPHPMLLTWMIVMHGMTSEERREARYKRRKEKRAKKKRECLKENTYENVISIDSLYKAAYEAAKGVRWKASVQRYLLHATRNAGKLHKQLEQGKDVRKGFVCFDIFERGKLRHIKSIHFSERVVQKSLCKNALNPIFTRSLIYDNGASQKGKGTKFATERFVKHLTAHVRRHGRSGGVLFIDFEDFFGNASHESLWRIYEEYIEDERLRNFAFMFIEAFDKGLGLGSETSQINAITLPNRMDHYAKEILRIKGYGRYMDDTYLIHEDKDYLLYCLDKIEIICDSLGIVINKRKTKICDLKHGMTFLKTRFFITETGKIVKKPCRKSITDERRRLKKHASLVRENVMTFKEAFTSYQSWRGSMKNRDAYSTIKRMDELFDELFIKQWR